MTQQYWRHYLPDIGTMPDATESDRAALKGVMDAAFASYTGKYVELPHILRLLSAREDGATAQEIKAHLSKQEIVAPIGTAELSRMSSDLREIYGRLNDGRSPLSTDYGRYAFNPKLEEGGRISLPTAEPRGRPRPVAGLLPRL